VYIYYTNSGMGVSSNHKRWINSNNVWETDTL
jgi:hypothetical protein